MPYIVHHIPGISQEVHVLDELSPQEGQIDVQRASISLQRVQATRRHSWPDRRASVVFGGMAALQICREMVGVRRVLKAAVSRGLDQANLVGRGHKYRWGCPQSCAFLTCPPRGADETHVKILCRIIAKRTLNQMVYNMCASTYARAGPAMH